MADDTNEDSWLYGNSSMNPEPPENEEKLEETLDEQSHENEEVEEDNAEEKEVTTFITAPWNNKIISRFIFRMYLQSRCMKKRMKQMKWKKRSKILRMV